MSSRARGVGLFVCGESVLTLIGFILNNITLVDYSGYRVIVPIAVLAFLGAMSLALLTWRYQSKPLKTLSILILIICAWQLQDAFFRRMLYLFGKPGVAESGNSGDI